MDGQVHAEDGMQEHVLERWKTVVKRTRKLIHGLEVILDRLSDIREGVSDI